MKWEKYNEMTPEQKEEWIYRFKESKIEAPFSINDIFMWIMIQSVFLSLIIALRGIPGAEILRLRLIDYATVMINLTGAYLVVRGILWLIATIWEYQLKKKWLKEQGLE
jgi:hypothetical protein